jgi:membrane protease YdiL (CAAX protease family)
MDTGASKKQLPMDYFVLVFLLAVPFWLLGGTRLPLPIRLPASALGTFVPALAAFMSSYRQSGRNGVKQLLSKAVDYRKIRNKIWYLPALFLAPLLYFLSFVVMRLARLPLPDPINIPLLMAPAFFVMFLIGDTGEELGWSGYATDPLQERWGAPKAGLILGVIWAIWHAIPFVQTGDSPSWVLWQCLKTVATRMVIVWVYNNSGKSVFAATLYHATDNVSWSLFPNYGSHYDSTVTGLLTSLAAVIVIFGWGGKTSARYTPAGASRT